MLYAAFLISIIGRCFLPSKNETFTLNSGSSEFDVDPTCMDVTDSFPDGTSTIEIRLESAVERGGGISIDDSINLLKWSPSGFGLDSDLSEL